jgi:hypothetical protein
VLRKYNIRINPLRAASAIFLLSSPFVTWITIVSVVIYQNVIIFGAAAQSNLLMVSSDQLGTNIPSVAVSGATASVLLLIIGGLTMVKSAKLGVPVAFAGLLAYLIPFSPVLGSSTSGLEQTFVSPGVGVFVAATGVALGSLSPLAKSQSAAFLLHTVKTRRGLSILGVSIGTIGLGLDALNHTALGQFSDFVGLEPIEQMLHLGLVLGVISMFAVVAYGTRISSRYLFALSVATLLLLGVDALYAFSTRNLHDFLGHNLTETVLHFSVYYGVALTLISGFLRKD